MATFTNTLKTFWGQTTEGGINSTKDSRTVKTILFLESALTLAKAMESMNNKENGDVSISTDLS